MLTTREWRRLRDQAGRLREAEQAYRLWLEGRASYRETERRLRSSSTGGKRGTRRGRGNEPAW